jgi:hypothetical protein
MKKGQEIGKGSLTKDFTDSRKRCSRGSGSRADTYAIARIPGDGPKVHVGNFSVPSSNPCNP